MERPEQDSPAVDPAGLPPAAPPVELAMIPVTSSMIASIGYDEPTRTLGVLFTRGNLYRYKDVPPETFAAFLGAESVGQFYGAHIRGKFEAAAA